MKERKIKNKKNQEMKKKRTKVKKYNYIHYFFQTIVTIL